MIFLKRVHSRPTFDGLSLILLFVWSIEWGLQLGKKFKWVRNYSCLRISLPIWGQNNSKRPCSDVIAPILRPIFASNSHVFLNFLILDFSQCGSKDSQWGTLWWNFGNRPTPPQPRHSVTFSRWLCANASTGIRVTNNELFEMSLNRVRNICKHFQQTW